MFEAVVPEVRPHAFCTTEWTVVLNARNRSSTEGFAALERLCRAHRHPLHFFVRRKGSSQTLANPADVDSEMRHLLEALM